MNYYPQSDDDVLSYGVSVFTVTIITIFCIGIISTCIDICISLQNPIETA